MWQPFTLTQQSWTDSPLLRKSAPNSTSQPDWVAHKTCLSFSPNTTIEAVRLSQTYIDEQATSITGPISPACDQYVQYLLTGTNTSVLNRHRRGATILNVPAYESTSRPLVNFGVLNDNFIKELISCIKWISKYKLKSTKYSFIHHLKFGYEANRTMWSTCIVKQQIVLYWRIYVKSSKKLIWTTRSCILTWFKLCDLVLNKKELTKWYL
jgi:hypothetical protein